MSKQQLVNKKRKDIKGTIAKIVRIVSLIISFGFVALAGIEVISGYLGDISLFGFNLTVAQQQITHYITSGGLALTGGFGIGLNEYLNRKLNQARTLVNEAMKITLETLNQVNEYQKSIGVKYDKIKMELENNNKLLTAFLETRLESKLISEETRAIIEGVLNETKH